MADHEEAVRQGKFVVVVDDDLQDLIPDYLEGRRKDIAAIRSALERDDLESIRSIGHKMKGSGGGYGFDRLLSPHPQCPYCAGEGREEIHAEDTRFLSPKAKLLYAGVKQTRDGFEIKMRDQDKAMENVARHLGMFVDKHEITGNMAFSINPAPLPGDDDT